MKPNTHPLRKIVGEPPARRLHPVRETSGMLTLECGHMFQFRAAFDSQIPETVECPACGLQPVEPAVPAMTTKLQQLIDLHSSLLKQNSYCYFELGYTRQTMWMAFICTNARELDPNRKVLAKGQGETPEAAADAALESFGSGEGLR